ncbi:hypothetical protein HKX48_001498 [Thoreauomyces humboldtii]|nr:hypothetical protein HKX48_001498 [Thoreauomyces humboldtii]
MSEFYNPLAAPTPTINEPSAPVRTASKGILPEDPEDNVPLAMVAQHLVEDENMLAQAEGMKSPGSFHEERGILDPTVPIVEVHPGGDAGLQKIPSMEGLEIEGEPHAHNVDSLAMLSSAHPDSDGERISIGNASNTAVAPSGSDRDSLAGSVAGSVTNAKPEFYDQENRHIPAHHHVDDKEAPRPSGNVVGGEKTHLTELERSATSAPPPEAESNLAGVATAEGVHPAEAKLQTSAGQTPWAFSRSAAMKEKFKQLESPITGIPGTKENPKMDPSFHSGTYRSCERSDKDLNGRILPNIAHFLMTMNPYINIAVITGCALAGWVIGTFGWSWLWTLFGGIGLALYCAKIRLSMSRAVDFEKKRNEATLTLGENVETAEWVNFLVAQLWPIIDPSLFTAAIDTLEDQFIAQAPSFITRINIADFELGPRAPRITSTQVYPKASGEDAILMDLTLALHPSPQEIASRTRLNTHVLINVHLGHPKLGSVVVPIMVEETGFEAQIRIWLKMSSKAPFVKTLKFTLLNKPKIDFAIKPLRLGNLMNMPILSHFIMGVIDKTVEDMLVSPKVMALELDRILMGDAAIGDTRAIGVAKFVFRQAKGLRAADLSGSSDPYCTVSFGNSSSFLARTRIISRDRNPMWNETHYTVITEDDVKNGFPLSVKVWDYDTFSRNEVLGQFEIRTEEVVDTEGLVFNGWKGLLKKNQTEDGKPDVLERNGKVNFQLEFFPKVDTKHRKESALKYKSGILAIQIHQALDLILKPKDKNGTYPSPYVHAFVNDQLAFKTRIKHDNPSPVWAFTKEFFIRDWTRAILRLVVKDSRQHEHDPVIGIVILKLSDLFKDDEDMVASSWHNLEGGIGFGKLRMSAAFRSVKAEEPENMRGYSVGEFDAKDFSIKGLDRICPGNAPPGHLRVRIRSPITEPARLATKESPSTFNPTWDESLTMRVVSRYQTALRFEVYQKGMLGFRSKILAVGKMYLQDMVDGQQRQVVLGLKRWKGANKKKDDEEEDHLGTTDKHVLTQELRKAESAEHQAQQAAQPAQGAEAAKQGLATDISGEPHVDNVSANTTLQNSPTHLSPPSDPSAPAPGRRVSISSARSSGFSDDSDDESTVGDDVHSDDSDARSVASFEMDPMEPKADSHTTVAASPELVFTAVFRAGRKWIDTPREGEDLEMTTLGESDNELEMSGDDDDVAAAGDVEGDMRASGGEPAVDKASKLFTLKGGAHNATSASNSPKSARKQKKEKGGTDDSQLHGNKLTRTLGWSKDTMMEGVKATRLWKRSSKKSMVLAGQEI